MVDKMKLLIILLVAGVSVNCHADYINMMTSVPSGKTHFYSPFQRLSRDCAKDVIRRYQRLVGPSSQVVITDDGHVGNKGVGNTNLSPLLLLKGVMEGLPNCATVELGRIGSQDDRYFKPESQDYPYLEPTEPNEEDENDDDALEMILLGGVITGLFVILLWIAIYRQKVAQLVSQVLDGLRRGIHRFTRTRRQHSSSSIGKQRRQSKSRKEDIEGCNESTTNTDSDNKENDPRVELDEEIEENEIKKERKAQNPKVKNEKSIKREN